MSAAAEIRLIPWKWREDLVARLHEGGGWIIRDPISADFTFLDDHEYFAARMLTGRLPMGDWMRRLSNQFPDFVVSSGVLHHFLKRLIDRNLVVCLDARTALPPRPEPVPSLISAVSRASGIFSFQIPVFEPTRLLNRLQPVTQFFFTRTSARLLVLLYVTALVVMVTRFGDFRRSIPSPETLFSRSGVVALAVTFCVVKCLHEFGHAVACHHFGARCRSLGIMFLILTPVLYTDVSEAWSLPRRQRLIVTAAGILTELAIAALCLLAWSVAADGFLRGLLTNVVLLCTVTTVLFNANPLLRFDGYFLLSDFASVPNLYQRAAEATGALFRRLIFGLPTVGEGGPGQKSQFIRIYGIAAFVYRILVAVAIARLLVGVAERFDQQNLGIALAALILISFLVNPLSVFLKHSAAAARGLQSGSRSFIRGVVFLCLFALVLNFPLSDTIVAPCIVIPGGEAVYVSEPGQLKEAAAYDDSLPAGSVVARLENPMEELRLQRLESELAYHSILTEDLKRLPGNQTPGDIATATEMVHALQTQVDAMRRKLSQLEIT
ncbi:MAG: hypothetical protein KDA89_16420, partial [Planctomycetaceae bacterium]|nr:hypothetical protein [Planctomycetaceae bacterium]